MGITYEQLRNGDYEQVFTSEDGEEFARFYVAAEDRVRVGDEIHVRDHTGELIRTEPVPGPQLAAELLPTLPVLAREAASWDWLLAALDADGAPAEVLQAIRSQTEAASQRAKAAATEWYLLMSSKQ